MEIKQIEFLDETVTYSDETHPLISLCNQFMDNIHNISWSEADEMDEFYDYMRKLKDKHPEFNEFASFLRDMLHTRAFAVDKLHVFEKLLSEFILLYIKLIGNPQLDHVDDVKAFMDLANAHSDSMWKDEINKLVEAIKKVSPVW